MFTHRLKFRRPVVNINAYHEDAPTSYDEYTTVGRYEPSTRTAETLYMLENQQRLEHWLAPSTPKVRVVDEMVETRDRSGATDQTVRKVLEVVPIGRFQKVIVQVVSR